jgi:hypothetical protein
VEADQSPMTAKDAGAHIPEDFAMRGQIWTQQYHPENSFEDCPVDDEERTPELFSMAASRIERHLWLVIKLSRVSSRGLSHVEG